MTREGGKKTTNAAPPLPTQHLDGTPAGSPVGADELTLRPRGEVIPPKINTLSSPGSSASTPASYLAGV